MIISINTVCLFPGRPLEAAFEVMKRQGFEVFEQWRIPEDQLASTRRQMDAQGMRLSGLCTGCFELNERARHEAYESALVGALRAAKYLGAGALISQVGEDTGAPRSEQHGAIVDGLRRVAPLLEQAGVTLLIEPLNNVRDHVGTYLTDSLEGFDIVREVGSPQVRLLYDIYHQLHMGEDVLDRIERHLSLIGHFHVAGFPARDERLWSGFDYRAVFELLRQAQVQVPVGIELMPSAPECVEPLLEQLRGYLG